MEHSYTILNHKTDFRFILHHICLLVTGLQNMHSFSVSGNVSPKVSEACCAHQRNEIYNAKSWA